ncbi:MAG TPA: thiamine pyrophosphate-binding protein [Vicinamibacterales bacterium]
MTCADIVARVLKDAGVTRMFGLPGGEILDFMDAARRAGIEFLLTRQEATAAFMADVTGQLSGVPGVCVATLGPGAVNMSLGVANAYLDRSPLLAITATHALSAAPFATHQNLDLNAVYRPFTKMAITLDGRDTAAKVRRAIDASLAPRRGPVHIAIPSDVSRREDPAGMGAPQPAPPAIGSSGSLDAVAEALRAAKRPVAILGLDLDPREHPAAVREFVESFGIPVFVTPKAKGIFPEDHPLFYGVCAGVSGDARVVDVFATADLLLGIGFEPVESDKLWHHSMPLVSVGPYSIAAGDFRPRAEATGDLIDLLRQLLGRVQPSFEWTPQDRTAFRDRLEGVLRSSTPPRGLSGYELTLHLRRRFPRETIFTTDVGSVKMITSQAWESYEPQTFLESNGLSAMSYALPAAMAARLQFPDRPILCTIGDGGFGMTLADIETCVRERLHFVTVVFNDNSLSLIDMAQRRRNLPTLGVRYGSIDFAAAARAMGAWARRVSTMSELDAALDEAVKVDAPVVIDAVVDPSEYAAQTAAPSEA